MGCDVHFHTEVKVAGKWEHYGHPNVRRFYRFFALLADVRNDGEIKPIAVPKGMPEDPSLITRLSCEAYGNDGHSHSWLSAAEIAEFEDRWHALIGRDKIWEEEADIEWRLVGYLEGNSWAGFHRYPQDRPKWIEDVRWVFWFDN